MTKREAAIVSAYTGILIGDFSVMHAYIKEIMGQPVFTHQLGDHEFVNKIKEAAKADFLAIQITEN